MNGTIARIQTNQGFAGLDGFMNSHAVVSKDSGGANTFSALQ